MDESRRVGFDDDRVREEVLGSFEDAIRVIYRDASESLKGTVNVFLHNSKGMPSDVGRKYTCVITSPPYTNRISYVREVRPYMYWLRFIHNARQAADLDWDATGGTWGIATSRLLEWTPTGYFKENDVFIHMIRQIQAKSILLSKYVHRYFEDMYSHFSKKFFDSLMKLRVEDAVLVDWWMGHNLKKIKQVYNIPPWERQLQEYMKGELEISIFQADEGLVARNG